MVTASVLAARDGHLPIESLRRDTTYSLYTLESNSEHPATMSPHSVTRVAPQMEQGYRIANNKLESHRVEVTFGTFDWSTGASRSCGPHGL